MKRLSSGRKVVPEAQPPAMVPSHQRTFLKFSTESAGHFPVIRVRDQTTASSYRSDRFLNGTNYYQSSQWKHIRRPSHLTPGTAPILLSDCIQLRRERGGIRIKLIVWVCCTSASPFDVCSMQNTSGDGREQVMVVSPPALERRATTLPHREVGQDTRKLDF